MSERQEIVWCLVCGGRFTAQEIHGWGCPKCQSRGVPCGCEQDVTVEINWHELRVLVIWAEQWARRSSEHHQADRASLEMPKCVAAIARRLQQQWPEFVPLTLSQELAQLPADLQKAGIQVGNVESNVPRPSPIPVNGPGAVGHARATLTGETK